MTLWQITEPDRSHSNADKTFHAITDGFEHASNLPIDSLAQYNPQMGWRNGVKLSNFCSATIQKNSARQFRSKQGIPRPIQSHLVLLFDFETWMR
jgi:hypothetical protein